MACPASIFMSDSVFTPADKADSKAVGAKGTRVERAAVMSAAFESIVHSHAERWVPPPIQKIIAEYDSARCTPPCPALPCTVLPLSLSPSRLSVSCYPVV
jgi:hypothetical protein